MQGKLHISGVIVKLFENSDNLEKDVTDYFKKNILDPAVQMFTKTVDHIFNCGVFR